MNEKLADAQISIRKGKKNSTGANVYTTRTQKTAEVAKPG